MVAKPVPQRRCEHRTQFPPRLVDGRWTATSRRHARHQLIQQFVPLFGIAACMKRRIGRVANPVIESNAVLFE